MSRERLTLRIPSALPEDMLTEDAGPREPRRVAASPAMLDANALTAIGKRLEAAERPLAVLGGTGWTDDALSHFAQWAQALDLPVALSWRRKDLRRHSPQPGTRANRC